MAKKQSIWSVFQSVLAAFFGVQSPEKYEEDNQQVDYKPHIIVGVVMTLVLVICLAYFVGWFVDATMLELNGPQPE